MKNDFTIPAAMTAIGFVVLASVIFGGAKYDPVIERADKTCMEHIQSRHLSDRYYAIQYSWAEGTLQNGEYKRRLIWKDGTQRTLVCTVDDDGTALDTIAMWTDK